MVGTNNKTNLNLNEDKYKDDIIENNNDNICEENVQTQTTVIMKKKRGRKKGTKLINNKIVMKTELDNINEIITNNSVDNINNIDNSSVNDNKEIKTRKPRKKKLIENHDDNNVLENINQDNYNTISVSTVTGKKKRGRKPKGGRLIHNNTSINTVKNIDIDNNITNNKNKIDNKNIQKMNNKKSENIISQDNIIKDIQNINIIKRTNIILHLRCSSKDILNEDNSILISPLEYNPNIEPIKAYNTINQDPIKNNYYSVIDDENYIDNDTDDNELITNELKNKVNNKNTNNTNSNNDDGTIQDNLIKNKNQNLTKIKEQHLNNNKYFTIQVNVDNKDNINNTIENSEKGLGIKLNNVNNNMNKNEINNHNEINYHHMTENVDVNQINNTKIKNGNNNIDLSLKMIWSKLKELQLKLHHNNIIDKRSNCFWCTYSFDNPPVYIPKCEYNNKYDVYGCFCSPECAAGYLCNESIDSSTKWERYAMLNTIYSKIYNYSNNIKPAPSPYYLLDKYYGSLTIEEYRKTSNHDNILLIVDKPLTYIYPEIFEDNNEYPNFNKNLLSKQYNEMGQLKKNSKNQYKLIRNKPVINKAQTNKKSWLF
jgi:hypothetical protein